MVPEDSMFTLYAIINCVKRNILMLKKYQMHEILTVTTELGHNIPGLLVLYVCNLPDPQKKTAVISGTITSLNMQSGI